MRFFVQLCSSWQGFNWLKAWRGPSAIAELLCFMHARLHAPVLSHRSAQLPVVIARVIILFSWECNLLVVGKKYVDSICMNSVYKTRIYLQQLQYTVAKSLNSPFYMVRPLSCRNTALFCSGWKEPDHEIERLAANGTYIILYAYILSC